MGGPHQVATPADLGRPITVRLPAGRRSDTGDLIPTDVSKGDKVVYSKYGGTEITIDGEDLLILQARDVLAIVK